MSNPEGKSFMAIRQVTDAITTLSVPFTRFGLFKFGGRATLIKLQSGGLVVVSPVLLTDEVRATLNTLGGQVAYIVAPDMEHHLQLGPWKAAFPAVRVIAPAELREKRAKASREDVIIDFPYSTSNKTSLELPADFAAEFDIEYFDGHANKEIALLHKPSRTLIEADLLFNTPSYEQYSKTGEDPKSGIFTKLAQAMFATLKGKSQQRFVWYVTSKPDRPSLNKSAARVAGWEFDKIIPCHGDVVEDGGSAVWKKLYGWHLEAARAEEKR